jgi:hypothetical protein
MVSWVFSLSFLFWVSGVFFLFFLLLLLRIERREEMMKWRKGLLNIRKKKRNKI